MSNPSTDILRLCAQAAPLPLYPQTLSLPDDLSRTYLDAELERLRQAGLLSLTEWTPDAGQGYVLTSAGVEALRRASGLPARRQPSESPSETEIPLNPRNRSDWERGEAVREALLTYATPVVTYTLLAINIGLFVCDIYGIKIAGQIPDRHLALQPADIHEGGWRLLRLLTCCFIHADMMHIFMNMLGLYFVGPTLEKMWGRGRFLALYLLSGVAGSITAAVMMLLRAGVQEPKGLVGASGALWGSMAAMAVWVLVNRRYLPRQLFRSWASNLFVVFGINIMLSFLPQISAAAHFGGGAAGAVCALLLHLQRHGRPIVRWSAAVWLVAMPLLLVGSLVFGKSQLTRLKAALAQAQRPDRPLTDEEVDRERREMDARLAEVRDLEKSGLNAYEEQILPLFDKRPERRRERDLAEAKTALEQAVANFHKAAKVLERAGPYTDDLAEKARLARLDVINSRIELFRFCQEVLDAGEKAKPEDETQRRKMESKVKELYENYRTLLQKK